MIALSLEAQRWLAAAGVLALYAAFCAAVAWRAVAKRRRARRAAAALTVGAGEPVLVAFASQTGVAEELALATAQALQAAGVPARLRDLAEVTAADLAAARRALFVVSTTGEGDSPDGARRFIRAVMAAEPDLAGLSHGVLALGDSGYAQFCAFGRTLDAWLSRRGATPLFDRVEVDDGDPAALRHWRRELGVISGVTDAPDWSRPAYGRWRLAERRPLNPGGPGALAFHLRLEPLDGAVDWRAGDIAEIGPRNAPAEVAGLIAGLGLATDAPVRDDGAPAAGLAQVLAGRRLPHDLDGLHGLTPQAVVDRLAPLPHREYSIASLPADGGAELIVRQMRRADGRLGLGSGWLTEHAPLGSELALRVRGNRGFHAPADDRPLILIGAGTGLAGLRAHLKARAASGVGRCWLVFGERTAAHDYFHQAEIEAWRADGTLARLDLAFSRDADGGGYVQDRLTAAADLVRAWVADGAAIYVCGAIEGMARGVQAALVEILGAEALEGLAEAGRYRRDVY